MKSVYSILTFSVNITYPKSYFENNINYLPFKYFDIILLDKKKNGKVVYLFPLVEEIMVDIYYYIINRNGTIYQIFVDSNLINSSSKGNMFEKYVIYNMNPKYSPIKIKNLFNYFTIKKNEVVEKFVPRDNENYLKKKIK
jgi:hypothetical protein